MGKAKIIIIDGVRYGADRPENCRNCFLWKNRKKGCTLDACYYLLEAPEVVKSPCTGCPYAADRPCVLIPCYKELVKEMHEKQGGGNK